MQDVPETLTLSRVLTVLRRRLLWIVLAFLIAVGIAYAVSKDQTPEYTATASVVFSESQLNQQIAGLPLAVPNNSTEQQATNVQVLQLGPAADKTAELLGNGLTGAEVRESLTASPVNTTNVVNVSATTTSPTLSAEITNTYCQVFVAEQSKAFHRSVAAALHLVSKELAELSSQQGEGAAGVNLQERTQSLRILAHLSTESVRLIQEAEVPTSPSGPSTKVNVLFGGLLGLLLGCGGALLLDRFDRRIREPGSLEQLYGAPLLGVIPRSGVIAASARRRTAPLALNAYPLAELPQREAALFQIIRAQIRHFNIPPPRTILVVSGEEGDGKTTVSCHLAEASAAAGDRTLLVDANLRAPALADRLGISQGPGLADALVHDVLALKEVTQSVEIRPYAGSPEAYRLDVLAAGFMQPANPAELIESPKMRMVLKQAIEEYDAVIIDTLALQLGPDAYPLLGEVDGCVVVEYAGKDPEHAEETGKILRAANATVVGVVGDGFKSGRASAPAFISRQHGRSRADKPSTPPVRG